MSDYARWFETVMGTAPYPWQRRLGEEAELSSRLIRIPTGLGKSAGVVLPWLFHRVKRDDARWPRRLCFVLPMRVLADQMAGEAARWIEAAGLDVPVHLLMGGVESSRWVEDLDRPAILIGTQDMLLSRALNRGYASSRGIWPMEFGALHSDCLWVYDEIQLMGVALATSTQLQAFRDASGAAALRPTHSWWMSATLQPEWLDSIDYRGTRREQLDLPISVPEDERVGGIWENTKTLEWAKDVANENALASLVLGAHHAGTQSLVVVNTVRDARELFTSLAKAISKAKLEPAPELHLAHSRFRPYERARWSFLTREAETSIPKAGRIIVATQVVEAGVDLSASLLVTQLAPYPSLVQRFGRAGRRAGEEARVIVTGTPPEDARSAAPYSPNELASAGRALERLIADKKGASIRALEESEASWPRELIEEVFPYRPAQVLRRGEIDDLFDTSPDLSGADLDVSRYIRVGEDRDARLFFRELEQTPRVLDRLDPPRRDELCPVPAHELEDWKKRTDVALYALDYESGAWIKTDRILPGMVILAPAAAGGYDPALGWSQASKHKVEVVPGEPVPESALVETSESIESDQLSYADEWKTIAFHGHEVEEEVVALLETLGLGGSLGAKMKLAARWHDAGKAHPVFAAAIREEARTAEVEIARRGDLAKAPASAWRRPAYPGRPGFRHELVSTLALFELLKLAAPDHEAVRGFSWPDDVPTPGEEAANERLSGTQDALGPLADELKALSAREFDLVAYLVCSHHGKVRCTWASSPFDQRSDLATIFGVLGGDELPSLELAAEGGAYAMTPPLTLNLEPAEIGLGQRYGRAWNDRVADLLKAMGPFTLAYLEALFRLADWRASKRKTEERRG